MSLEPKRTPIIEIYAMKDRMAGFRTLWAIIKVPILKTSFQNPDRFTIKTSV